MSTYHRASWNWLNLQPRSDLIFIICLTNSFAVLAFLFRVLIIYAIGARVGYEYIPLRVNQR